MAVGTLHDELLAIPGIDGAELEGDAATPVGVRVQLSPGADPQAVGQAVQQVLAAHGMRSQMADELPVAPGSVVNLADYEADRLAVTEAAPPQIEVAGSLPPAATSPPEQPATPAPTTETQAPPSDVAPPAPARALTAVTVREDRAGVAVTVTADSGASASRAAPATPRGLERAAVGAVMRLVDPPGDPRLIAVTETKKAGSTVILVLLEDVRGVRSAGASTLRGDRAAAVARAALSAINEADPGAT